MMIIPTHVVPMGRARQWFIGERPLPGNEEDSWMYFFTSQGMSTATAERKCAEHRRLTRIEDGLDDGMEGIPPAMLAELLRRGWTPPAVSREAGAA